MPYSIACGKPFRQGDAMESGAELIDLFNKMISNFNHKETGKFLDGRF